MGSFNRSSHRTVAIQPMTAIASSEEMNVLPNQSSIWPRSRATSRLADAMAIREIPVPST